MNLEHLINVAFQQGASDLHLEPGLPPAVRVRGALRVSGEPLAPQTLLEMARRIIGAEHWPHFLERRSFDLSRTIRGVRCRLNVLQTARGVGLCVRLLAAFQATVETLNLHPDLKKFIARETGLVLLTGPTGCGKSSTLAALIQEINLAECRHIVTIESPIEYTFTPHHSYLRQREVGRDTPSFEQALLDALREDPDVLMVGEMRDPETMRLTLNAAETGHLVLSTLHSGTCTEALQRLVNAFPAEAQHNVRAQLADCFVAVVAQRLRFRPELKIVVPECEILLNNSAVRAHIRTGEFFKIPTALETGADQGMWTFTRYQAWLDGKKNWYLPAEPTAPDTDAGTSPPALPALATAPPAPPTPSGTPPEPGGPSRGRTGGPIEIEPVEGGLEGVLREFGDEPP